MKLLEVYLQEGFSLKNKPKWLTQGLYDQLAAAANEYNILETKLRKIQMNPSISIMEKMKQEAILEVQMKKIRSRIKIGLPAKVGAIYGASTGAIYAIFLLILSKIKQRKG